MGARLRRAGAGHLPLVAADARPRRAVGAPPLPVTAVSAAGRRQEGAPPLPATVTRLCVLDSLSRSNFSLERGLSFAPSRERFKC